MAVIFEDFEDTSYAFTFINRIGSWNRNTATVVNVSGEVGWTKYSQALNVGSNLVRLEYNKDGSVSRGADSGFIDNITVSYIESPFYCKVNGADISGIPYIKENGVYR